jgi:S-layer homology domain
METTKERKMMRRAWAAAILVSAGAVGLMAQVPVGEPGYVPEENSTPDTASAPQSPNTFGTNGFTAVTLSTWGFSPLGDGTWSHFGSTGWSYRSIAGNTTACENVNLPSGSTLEYITTFTDDTDAGMGHDVTHYLYRFNVVDSTSDIAFTFTTSGAPGIQRVLRTVTPPVTVSNQQALVLCIEHGVGGATNRSAGDTLWYRLQVSPAPLVATFGDVPTGHPFFRFVEALAAAGITGGCGGGNFCPDNSVTRGQMAVFLSVALGLHFPN